MEENKKIKVVMICHFSNAEVREHLPLSNGRLYRFMRRVLKLPMKRQGYSDLAPWDSSLIRDFKQRDDIELFVISAHSGLKKRTVSFNMDNVNYLFVRCNVATMLKHIVKKPDLWLRLNPMTPTIVNAVKNYNPDLVLLVGAENAYYSSSVLSINEYPVYVLCQTIYNDPAFKEAGYDNAINAAVERKIFDKVQYVGVFSDKHYNLLKKIPYDKNIFRFRFSAENTLEFEERPIADKPIDFINFALQMSFAKGFEDCVKALAIVKKHYPNVKLHLVDGGPDDYRSYLKGLISELGIEKNVTFIPFFADRSDLFAHLQMVKFAVLPCKLDNLSGTQIQSMRYGLPVVCYKTTGTPTLNADKECVLIAEMNDIEGLASNMLFLMDNPGKAEELRSNSKQYIGKLDKSSQDNADDLVRNFNSIVDNFKNNIPIPSEQLY